VLGRLSTHTQEQQVERCHLPHPILEGTSPSLAEMGQGAAKAGIGMCRAMPGSTQPWRPFPRPHLRQGQACRKSRPSRLADAGEPAT